MNESYVEKIKTESNNHWKDNKEYFDEILKVYIDLKGKHKKEDSDDLSFDLRDRIEQFLLSKNNIILMLGEAGGGKSVFSEIFEKDKWDQFKENDMIPVRISLPDIIDPVKQLLKEHFENMKINRDEL